MSLLRNKEFRTLLYLVVITLIAGAIFYHFYEGWNWIDSLYFSSVTLTTVGYGDLHPTSGISKIFTIVYAVIGIGILFTFINFWANERIKRIEKKIKNGVHKRNNKR